MTELQVKAAELKEAQRHNEALERLQKEQNLTTKQHYETSDAYTGAHYERSDQASLISANANAMNAQTNRLNYDLAYSLEHVPGIDLGYGDSSIPLSAQKKIAEIENLTWTPATYQEKQVKGYVLDEDTGRWVPVGPMQDVKHENNFIALNADSMKAKIAETKMGMVSKGVSAANDVLNTIFGKGGIIRTIVWKHEVENK